MFRPIQGRYTMGLDPNSPEFKAQMDEQAKKQMEARDKVTGDLVLPPAAKAGIGIGGLLLIGAIIWFFFLRKK